MCQQGLNLRGRKIVIQKVAGEFNLGLLDLLQSLDAASVSQLVDLNHHLFVGDGHRIVQIQHADRQAVRVNHWHMLQIITTHPGNGAKQIVGSGNGMDRRRHHFRDRISAVDLKSYSTRDVLFSDDAQHLSHWIGNNNA